MKLKELRGRIIRSGVARVDGHDGPSGPQLRRVVLKDGTEIRFDWKSGSTPEHVGILVRRTATEAPGRRPAHAAFS